MAPPSPSPLHRRPVAASRDRLQSRLLTGTLLCLLLAAPLARQTESLHYRAVTPGPLLLSLIFAALAWRLRSATPAAALAGGLICLQLASTVDRTSESWVGARLLPAPAGLLALIVLFLLTSLATRFGRRRKHALGLAEHAGGRRLAQVLANLGVAALAATAGLYASALAALAEATADTVSSEVGQALGGPTFLLTTGERTTPGTDGGVSLRGTAAGLLGAALVLLAGMPRLHTTRTVGAAAAAATLGFFADSLLGATLERRGLLGNDAVNTLSTLVSALAALAFTGFL